MAFKTFYFSLWLLFILFTVVKGSCLEYGHSCWGGHGKRSGSNKIYRTEIQTPTEVDFQDVTGLKEKANYDSGEEQMNDSGAALSAVHDNDELVEAPDKNTNKLKKLLFKKLNKANGKQRNFELTEDQAIKSNSMLRNKERWQHLPYYNYNLRRVQITRPDNEWLKELGQEQQIDEEEYI